MSRGRSERRIESIIGNTRISYGKLWNLFCSVCGRSTKHRRVKKKELDVRARVFNGLFETEHWKCMRCENVKMSETAAQSKHLEVDSKRKLELVLCYVLFGT